MPRSQRTLKASPGSAPPRPPSRQKAFRVFSRLRSTLRHSAGPLASKTVFAATVRAARSTAPIRRVTPPARQASSAAVLTSDCSAQPPPGCGAITHTRRARASVAVAAIALQGSTGSVPKTAGSGVPATERKVPRASALRATRPASKPSGASSWPGRSAPCAVLSQGQASCTKALAVAAPSPVAAGASMPLRSR